MYTMLRCEFFKLSKSKAFLVIVLSLFITTIILPRSDAVVGYIDAMWDSLLIVLVASIFAGIFIGNDFKNKTIHGSVSCGTSRIAVFSSKVIVFFFTTVLFNIIYPLAVFISASIFSPSPEIIPLETIKTLIFLGIACVLSNCVAASIITVFAFWFKNGAVIIGVSLGVLAFAGDLIKKAMISFTPLAKYLPFSLNRELFLKGKTVVATEDMITVGIVSIGYTIIFLIIAYRIFRKADLK